MFRKAAADGDDAYALVATSTLPQAAIGGLVEGASYDLRVVAVNGRGPSAPSAAVRVTTKAALYKFDVQLAGNPLMPGYTEVEPALPVHPGDRLGLRWTRRAWAAATGASASRRRRTTCSATSCCRAPSTCSPSTCPNGTYAVKTYNGDWIGTSRSNVQLEGKDFGASNAGAGSVSEKVSQPVLVTDGQLEPGDDAGRRAG